MESFVPSLFMSNDTEALYAKLRSRLFDQKSLFRKVVIVPNGLIKDHLYKKLIEDQTVIMGFKVLKLPAAVDYIMRLIDFDDKKSHAFPAPALLSLHLEAVLWEFLENKEERCFEALFEHILKQKSEKVRSKIQEISDALSVQFLQDGMYGSAGLKEWFKKKSWQQCLWEKVFALWDYPYKLFEEGTIFNSLGLEMEIHLFGFSFIPRIYEKFFDKLSLFFQFHHYYLTPCQYFWGDLCSERERFFLKRFYEKRGVARAEIAELDSYLKTENAFLANFGKQTQRRFNALLDKEYVSEELFVYPFAGDLTLLQAIKGDLLHAKGEEKKTFLQEEDFSIQLHRVPSKKREIEVLLATLMDLTYKHEIAPSDILVLAPEISEYFPFIYQTFNNESPFAIDVQDLEMMSQSQFLQGFWQILCLKDLRWEKKDLFRLLMITPLLRKIKMTKEDVLVLKKWSEVAQIRWGYNHKHRNEKISLLSPEEKMLESSEVGTWKYGLQRLSFGLVNAESEEIDHSGLYDFFPIEEVEMTEAPLLGRFITFIDHLYEDMVTFSKAELSLSEWACYFKNLAQKYFCIEASDIMEKQAFDFFIEQLKVLLQLSSKVPQKKYPFSSLKHYFQKAFRKKRANFSDSNKEAIRFASLKPQQLYPVKILCLIGMDEENFPRASKQYPLREIEEGKMDAIPSTIEEDRQIFLDVILYAKNFVIMSYCNVDIKDGKEKNPSFLIEEFLNYCDRYYLYMPSEKHPSKKITYTHASLAFHKQELSPNSPFLNFSLRNYRLAQSYYRTEKKQEFFIPEFYHTTEKPPEVYKETSTMVMLTLRDLKAFARNPLQYYLNHSLGVYLDREMTNIDQVSKEFIFPILNKALFRLENFGKDFEESYETLALLGALPLGVFKEITKDQLKEERENLLARFSSFGVDPSKVMTIELNAQCFEPFQKNLCDWVVPALEVVLSDKEVFLLEGKLDQVSEQGLVFHGKDCYEDSIKIWPIYLVFHKVVSKWFSHKIKKNLLFTKDGKIKNLQQEDVTHELECYLNYYKKGKNNPSPLLPVWSKAILSESKEETAKAIAKSFSSVTGKSSYASEVDIYQKWCFMHLQPFCAHALQEQWSEELKSTFKSLKAWNLQEVQDA